MPEQQGGRWQLAACVVLALPVRETDREEGFGLRAKCQRNRAWDVFEQSSPRLGALRGKEHMGSHRGRGGWEARCLMVQGQEQRQCQAPTCRRPAPMAPSPSPPRGRRPGWRTRGWGCCRCRCCCTHCRRRCCPAGRGTGPRSAGVGTRRGMVAGQGVGPQSTIDRGEKGHKQSRTVQLGPPLPSLHCPSFPAWLQ